MTVNMKQISLLITLLFVTVQTKPTSDTNVTKRDISDDLFPDWVPFKNKHGNQLGEFVQVEPKKPKKRLALPVNFVLRAVVEPELDYSELGQGDGDSEDYYEKREWSDTNRPAQTIKPKKVNHTEISDIDGVVGIITKPNPSVIKEERIDKSSEESKSVESEAKENEKSGKSEEKKPNKEPVDSPDSDSDYEEAKPEKKPEQTDEERRENEARKAKILSAVDELKERHALEQKAIQEKSREEAMQKEERERDFVESSENDKYLQRSAYKKLDYDEYEDKETNVEDKYKINPLRRPTIAPRAKWITSKKEKKTKDSDESGKLSVFRNPSVYMVYDEESTTESPKTTEKVTKSTKRTRVPIHTRYSAKYTTPTKESSDESERISLVPDGNELKEGEPTLFFPKRRKNKRRRKNKSTTVKPEADSYVAESHQDKTTKDILELSHTGPSSFSSPSLAETSSTGPASTALSSSELMESRNTSSVFLEPISTGLSGSAATGSSGPTASGSGASDPVSSESVELTSPDAKDTALSAASAPSTISVDAEPASSDHKKEEKKHENSEFEHGGEKEHHSEHHSSHGESGKKAYEGQHKDTKTAKGHHDKEDHLGSYHDHGGHNEEHHDEKQHYGHHHHEEHGKKHAEYEESGKHSKGHSTKGSHDIHKKEEYEKKVEFFEEEGDSADEEKHGGHNHERGHKSGGGFKKNNLDAAYHDHVKGDSGHSQKGGSSHHHKGHKSAAGHDSHGKHGAAKQHKGFKEGGKKWVYHHGYPAKNANLVVIDRRADQFFHGPQYYG